MKRQSFMALVSGFMAGLPLVAQAHALLKPNDKLTKLIASYTLKNNLDTPKRYVITFAKPYAYEGKTYETFVFESQTEGLKVFELMAVDTWLYDKGIETIDKIETYDDNALTYTFQSYMGTDTSGNAVRRVKRINHIAQDESGRHLVKPSKQGEWSSLYNHLDHSNRKIGEKIPGQWYGGNTLTGKTGTNVDKLTNEWSDAFDGIKWDSTDVIHGGTLRDIEIEDGQVL